MTIKVKELYKMCEEQINKGNGDKKVLISADDEGNGFHHLFYSFMENVKEYQDEIYCVREEELDDYIILG